MRADEQDALPKHPNSTDLRVFSKFPIDPRFGVHVGGLHFVTIKKTGRWMSKSKPKKASHLRRSQSAVSTPGGQSGERSKQLHTAQLVDAYYYCGQRLYAVRRSYSVSGSKSGHHIKQSYVMHTA